MAKVQQQWKKRVGIFRFVFSILMNDETRADKIKQQAFENNLFEPDQIKVIDFFADHYPEIIKLISQHLEVRWTWERIPQVDKAVLISAYCEFKVTRLERKIVIDQSLVTIKHFGEPNSVKYINAILDKIIR